MRIANVAGRLHLMDSPTSGVDVEQASGGRFGADPQDVYDRWEEFVEWAGSVEPGASTPVDEARIEAPTPFPKQVFALGLNYRDHAEEAGLGLPDDITVFTKFASSFCGPIAQVRLPEGGLTDWEVELVVVIGRGGRDIPEASAWEHVAGLTLGQDISERRMQGRGVKQFSLAKSLANFTPMGPVVATPDEFADKDDIALRCSLNGELMQDGHTREMIFNIPRAIHELTQVVGLYPGDVIFTGTPAGVGVGRKPKLFLKAGDVLESSMDVVGGMRQTFVD